MIKYVFRDRPVMILGDHDPQKIGEALAKVREETEGRCNARTFYEAAKDKKNYLHRLCEWNDAVAGEKYRLQQIREVIGCIDLIDDERDDKNPVPAFISLTERNGRGYRPIGEVLDSVELQAISLRHMKSDVEALERRASRFEEICDALKAAREVIEARLARDARGRERSKKKKGRDDRPAA